MKSALMVWGGGQEHFPKECAELWAPILKEKGFEVEVSDTLDSYLDQEKMQKLDLIVQIWTMGSITNDQEKALLEAIKSGTGFGGWHGGIGDSFRDHPNYQFLVGGQWVALPVNDPTELFSEYEVNITNHDHEITKGLTDFSITSEHYYLLTDPTNEVLATTDVPAGKWMRSARGVPVQSTRGAVMPAVWTRTFGAGRVFYTSLGHRLEDFDIPQVREIVSRGLLWASK
jgi:type 1 glutamine amidotransferase